MARIVYSVPSHLLAMFEYICGKMDGLEIHRCREGWIGEEITSCSVEHVEMSHREIEYFLQGLHSGLHNAVEQIHAQPYQSILAPATVASSRRLHARPPHEEDERHVESFSGFSGDTITVVIPSLANDMNYEGFMEVQREQPSSSARIEDIPIPDRFERLTDMFKE